MARKKKEKEQEQDIILPIDFMYRGKLYKAGTNVNTCDEDTQHALLIKILSLIEAEERNAGH